MLSYLGIVFILFLFPLENIAKIYVIFQTNKFPLENKYYLTITCFHVPYSLKS